MVNARWHTTFKYLLLDVNAPRVLVSTQLCAPNVLTLAMAD